MLLGAGSEWTPPQGCWFFGGVTEGFGYYFGAGRADELAPGVVIAGTPVATAILRSSQLGPLRFQWFVLDINRLYGVLTLSERGWLRRGYEVGAVPQSYRCDRENGFGSAFAISTAGIGEETNAISHRAKLLSVVAAFLAQMMPAQTIRQHPFLNSTERLEQLLGTLTEAEFLALSVEDLADACRCDRRRVLQIFRQVFGSSFRDYQSDLRKLRVSQMMEQGASLHEIARECGYDTPESFRAWFRRAFGTGLNRWADEHQIPIEETAGNTPPSGSAAAV